MSKGEPSRGSVEYESVNARTSESVAFLNHTSFQNFWKSASVVMLSCAMMEKSVPSSFLKKG